MNRKSLLLLLVVALATAAFWFTAGGRSNGQEVEVGQSVRRDVFRSYATASGQIVASRYANVGSSVMGRLVRLHVAEGDAVRAGQVVAQIDALQAESQVAAQEALVRGLESEEQAGRQQLQAFEAERKLAAERLAEAERNLRRLEELRDSGLISAAELDTARSAAAAASAQLDSAQAQVERAERALEAGRRRVLQARAQAAGLRDVLNKTAITAPMDGTVTLLQVREGEMVVVGVQNQPGTILMTVSDLANLNAEVQVAEADVVQIRPGQTALVTLPALPNLEFDGEVTEVGSSALPLASSGGAAREFRVVIRVQNPDPRLRPGMTCDVEVLTSERRAVVTVPLQAVVLQPGHEAGDDVSGVFLLLEGRGRFLPVQTGIVGGLEMEVGGLDAGAPVIVGPVQVLRDLRDGDAVHAADR